MRINVVDPKLLSDVHLRAEYREILMLPYYYVKSSNSKNGIVRSKISPTYTLNTGHAYFFYDKVGFVNERYIQLDAEMQVRGFKRRDFNDWQERLKPVLSSNMNSYTVTDDDRAINNERILKRITTMHNDNKKPNYYKMNGKNCELVFWKELYASLRTESY